jgi:hypothetical protein
MSDFNFEKPLSQLKDKERNALLSEMSAEDYTEAHQLQANIAKLKEKELALRPHDTLQKRIFSPTKKVYALPLRAVAKVAALLLLGLSCVLFFSKKSALENKQNSSIENKENIAQVIDEPINKPINKPTKSISKKRLTTRKTNTLPPIEEVSFEQMMMTFHKENPNLQWQTDDEESEAPKETEQPFLCK